MRRHLNRTAIAIGLLTALAGCSSEPSPQSVTGPMTAKIDGSAWTASAGAAATYTNGILGLAGTDGSGRTIGLGGLVPGPGTYAVGATSPANFSLTMGGSGWSAAITSGTGSFTVTAISTTGAKGTFQFTAAPLTTTGAAGNKVVTEGTFDVTF